MTRLPDDISEHDVSQWLRSTWFYVTPKKGCGGEDRLACWRGLCRDPETEELLVEVAWAAKLALYESGAATPTTRELYARVSLDRIRCVYPRGTAINQADSAHAVYYYRAATHRQYRRSFSSSQYKKFIPQRWYHNSIENMGGRRRRPGDPGARDIMSIFYPTYPNFDDAYRQVRSKERHSVAVAKNVILCGAGGDKILLYYRTRLIGEMVDLSQLSLFEDVHWEVAQSALSQLKREISL
jgi:hypothetical protein